MSLLKNSVGENRVKGVGIYGEAPSINHLLFTDDSIILCKANMMTNRKVKNLLDSYEKAWGQKLNIEKTSMVFSRNVNAKLRDEKAHFCILTTHIGMKNT